MMKEREFKTAFSIKIKKRSFVLLVQQDSNDDWVEAGILDEDNKAYLAVMCYKGRLIFQNQEEVNKVHKKVAKMEERYSKNKMDANHIELRKKFSEIINNL